MRSLSHLIGSPTWDQLVGQYTIYTAKTSPNFSSDMNFSYCCIMGNSPGIRGVDNLSPDPLHTKSTAEESFEPRMLWDFFGFKRPIVIKLLPFAHAVEQKSWKFPLVPYPKTLKY